MLEALIEFTAQAVTEGLAEALRQRRRTKPHQPAARETIPGSLRDPKASSRWTPGHLEITPTALIWRPHLGRSLHLRRLGTICVSRRASVPEELADGFTVRLECNGRVVDLAVHREHVKQLDEVLTGATTCSEGGQR